MKDKFNQQIIDHEMSQGDVDSKMLTQHKKEAQVPTQQTDSAEEENKKENHTSHAG